MEYIKQLIEDFEKLGYTHEKASELAELAQIPVTLESDFGVDSATDGLIKTFREINAE